MALLNGIQHDDAHSAIGDCIATMEIAKIIFKKAPNVWKASQLTTDKIKTMDIIKKSHFCVDEFFYGKTRPFVETFVCEHPVYKWAKCFDLKHDPEPYLKMDRNFKKSQ